MGLSHRDEIDLYIMLEGLIPTHAYSKIICGNIDFDVQFCGFEQNVLGSHDKM